MEENQVVGSQPKESCGLAIASLVLGIMGTVLSCVGIGFFLGLPAVICGHIALSRIRKANGALSGEGAAIGGLVTGYISTFLTAIAMIFILAGMLFSPLSQAREKARQINCSGNLKSIGLALRMYSQDYDEHFPPALNTLKKHDYLTAGKVYICPSTTDTPAQAGQDLTPDTVSYQYFGAGTGLTESNQDAQTIIACDKPGNHRRCINVLFADGHVKSYVVKDGETIEQFALKYKFILPPR
ncbi:MAG: DUF4190 domain-containing protein [Lentisphaeria bacterium]|nr:DUF4190 domain-containing protein [Lentisphaeria bacterium]